jgi:ferredoxin
MRQLLINSKKCGGCKICELICSVRHFGVHNPKKARINIIARFPEKKFKILVCNQCGKCMNYCPADAIYKKKYAYVIDTTKCTNCGSCVAYCKRNAIFVHPALSTPIKCELCGLCALYCPSGALKLVK